MIRRYHGIVFIVNYTRKEEERRRNHENDEDKISEQNPLTLGTTTIGFNDFNGHFLT